MRSLTAPELIDRALGSRALVYGSLPPEGRDLDLLVRPTEKEQIEDCLLDAGFLRRGAIWARFAGCTVELVDLMPAAAWRLPREELDALFDEAWTLDGFTHLARPAPHHVLLILARRAAREGGRLDGKRRDRIRQAIDDDSDAWARARTRAHAWGAESLIERLQELERAPAAQVAAASRDHWLRLPSRGAVIAFSGLDGAGKSTQAVALRDTLDRLGYDATVVWTRIMWDDALWRVALPVKAALERSLRILASLRSPLRSDVAGHRGPRGGAEVDDRVKRLREGSGLATHAWTLVIALTNAVSQRRLTWAAVWRGRVIICDRYMLD
ncbi:MAG: hypothetical protein M3295_10655, partial [Chloroflexota bacterium]|nr:hypothetical protein [Chloroflexota bacterium]